MSIDHTNTIPVDDLVVGGIYLCVARYFRIGIWNGSEFRGLSSTQGRWGLVSEAPWDQGLPLGTARAIAHLNTERRLKAFDGTDVVAFLFALEELLAVTGDTAITL